MKLKLLSVLLVFCFANALADQTSDQLGGHVQAIVDGETLLFPTLKTNIDADIQGELATVTVRQTFANPLNTPLHATYLFPLNKEAAVFEMILEVGDERIRADIQRIEEARATFAKAKNEGRSAALLSQHRPNMFTQDIANLMPGLPVDVTLRYVQPLPKIDGDYELVIPLVVGPRFQPAGDDNISAAEQDIITPPLPVAGKPTQSGVVKWNLEDPPVLAGGADKADSRSAFGVWETQQLPAYPPVTGLHIPDTIDQERVSINIKLDAGMPVQSLNSPSHALEINTQSGSGQRKNITLAAGKTIDNSDFILRYRLAAAEVQAGVLAHRDERGGFFSLLLEPPALEQAVQVTQREMVFVLDCSGSMNGLPIEASKTFARLALSALRPGDSFRIIRFSDQATEFSARPLAATPANIQRGTVYLNSLRGSGGTVMSSGIQQALNAPLAADTLRLVVFLTDGYIGNEYEILDLIHKQLGTARLYAFGVGTSVNRFLLEEMARTGRGFVRYMDPTENVNHVAEALAQRLQSPVLTDLRIDWGELDPAQISPRLIPDLFAGQSLRILGRYQTPGIYEITVHGRSSGQNARLPLRIELPQTGTSGEAIALSWARAEIKQAMHQLSAPMDLRIEEKTDATLKNQVIKLGLDFSLITQWTAFVAVTEKIYNSNVESTPTRPVPLAQVKGVSELAYGEKTHTPMPAKPHQPMQIAQTPAQMNQTNQFNGNAAPEPAFFASFALLGLLLLTALKYRERRLA